MKIFHHILFAIHDEDPILNMEEFLQSAAPQDRGLRFLSISPFQFLLKHHDQFILHPQLGIIEEDGDIRQEIVNPGKEGCISFCSTPFGGEDFTST